MKIGNVRVRVNDVLMPEEHPPVLFSPLVVILFICLSSFAVSLVFIGVQAAPGDVEDDGSALFHEWNFSSPVCINNYIPWSLLRPFPLCCIVSRLSLLIPKALQAFRRLLRDIKLVANDCFLLQISRIKNPIVCVSLISVSRSILEWPEYPLFYLKHDLISQ